MSKVYLAYAPEDESRAEELRRILLAQHIRPWLDPQPTSEPPWQPDQDSAIEAADALILLLTPDAAASISVTYAWAYALGRQLPVFVIVYEEADEHPRLQLTRRHDLRDFGDENHFWDHFLADLKLRLREQGPAVQPPIEEAEIDSSLMPSEPGYWLVMRRGPLLNQLFRLEREVVNIGRDAANDIVIPAAQVSRYHLRLSLRDGDYQLEDLGSSNGTRVNGSRARGMTSLNDGDVIALGESVLLTYDLVYAD